MKRKVLSLLLALTLCIGIAVPALAAESVIISARMDGDDVPHIEIANVVSQSKYPFPDGQDTATVYYTNAPTTITVLRDLEGGDIGRSVEVISLNSDGVFRFDDNPEYITPVGGYLTNDYDDEYVPSGSVYELSEGVYFLFAANAQKWTIIVVGETSGNTSEPTPENPSSWASEQVNAAIKAGLVPVTLQSKYTTAATRAEFCALAVALYETVTGKEITDRATFIDTKDVNVEKAAAIGVVSGVGDNKFSPDTQLTREQAATMLSRLANAIGKPLTEQAPTFADNASISSWAFDAVGQMQATGIMGGVGNNTFAPKNDYTREQSIITILRLYDEVK